MEGLYSKDPGPLILLPAERPASRQSYSCAHELGHHVAGHGTHVDELLEEKADGGRSAEDPDEFLVECFAGFLLMPKLAVERALACRGWKPSSLTAEQAYVIAGQLGVGYTTLLQHMRWSLGILPGSKAEELLKVPLKRIRRGWLNRDTTANLLVMDHHWAGRPVDLHVGDYLLVPDGTQAEAPHLHVVQETVAGRLFEAQRAGRRRTRPVSTWAPPTRFPAASTCRRARFRSATTPP